jgi:hypothetical protein
MDGGVVSRMIEDPNRITKVLPVRVQVVRDLLPTLFSLCRYRPRIEDALRFAIGTRVKQFNDPVNRGFAKRELQVEWWPAAGDRRRTELSFVVYYEDRELLDRAEMDRVDRLLEKLVRRYLARFGEEELDPDAPLRNPVIAPGGELMQPFTGNLLDYSGCAMKPEEEPELKALLKTPESVLPLGRYAFTNEKGTVEYGQPLYMNRDSSQRLMEYKGTMICAPQNSGKTRLVIRWAVEANKHGYSTFIVDVKGNLYEKLRAEHQLQGKVYYFSTNPRVDENVPYDQINFLAGPPRCEPLQRWLTPLESERIRELVISILPGEGWTEKGGRGEFHYQNRVVWLNALIHILRLYYFYDYAGPDFNSEAGPQGQKQHRTPDLSDLYRLVTDHHVLYAMISRIWEAQKLAQQDNEQELPEHLTIEHWASEVSLLLEREMMRRGAERDEVPAVEGGRPAKEPYRNYTQGLVLALEPFSKHGTLHERVCDNGRGRLFALEDLGKEQVTIIFAAREQDLDKSKTVLAIAIKKLQHFLYDRMDGDEKKLQKILLLLDETRRIRSFKVNEYVTFAREAKAGCVVVYQSLDQVGDSGQIMELLENIGTQIYLGSLVGNTAKYFIDILPKRYRTTFSTVITHTPDGRTRAEDARKELVDYLTTNELYRLRTGRWPALIYLNDQPRRKPVLVSMDESVLQAESAAPRAENSTGGESATGAVTNPYERGAAYRRRPR